MKSISVKVKQGTKKTPVLEYAALAFPQLGSRTAVKKAIAAENLRLNDRLARFQDVVRGGDRLELLPKKIKKVRQTDVTIPIIFEDDYLLIANKPGGIATNGNRNKTVENLVRMRVNTQTKSAFTRPVAAHRIDVPTKGLVVLAKTKSALIGMGKLFQQRKVAKTYYAVVHGKLTGEGQLDLPIEGKAAVTKYQSMRVVQSRKFGYFSLVKLQPTTGRTHQLRIHLQKRGHLIVGDKQYAKQQWTILGKGLFLCAAALAFQHPVLATKVTVEIPLPSRFTRLLDRENARF